MDYRYFPDPDLPPLVLTREFIDERVVEELPIDRRMKYQNEYKLIEDDARILSNDRITSDFYEKLVLITNDAKNHVPILLPYSLQYLIDTMKKLIFLM